MAKVTVIGATTWGTTLGIILARKSTQVVILARTIAEASQLQSDRQNVRFLPEMTFPDSMTVSADPLEALTDAHVVIVAVPSRAFRTNIQKICGAIRGAPLFVSVAKGIEMESSKRMSQVLEEELPPHLHSRVCALSGPNLAKEIVEGKPSSTVIASYDSRAAEEAREVLMSPTFRVYTNDDVAGVELAGALKNIIVLGAGISDGLGYGDNGKAALITRGLAEITRLGVAAGASPATFAGLAGMGDLVATCASHLSRNRYVGEQLAQGRSLDEILASMNNVAEGVYTTAAALKMAAMLGVEMPITQATYQVLFEGLNPMEAVTGLMGRPPRSEGEESPAQGQ